LTVRPPPTTRAITKMIVSKGVFITTSLLRAAPAVAMSARWSACALILVKANLSVALGRPSCRITPHRAGKIPVDLDQHIVLLCGSFRWSRYIGPGYFPSILLLPRHAIFGSRHLLKRSSEQLASNVKLRFPRRSYRPECPQKEAYSSNARRYQEACRGLLYPSGLLRRSEARRQTWLQR